MTEHALIQRLNRKLKPNQQLKTSRTEQSKVDLGKYFIVDQSTVTAKHVDLEKWARKLEALQPWEQLERTVSK